MKWYAGGSEVQKPICGGWTREGFVWLLDRVPPVVMRVIFVSLPS